MKRFVFACVLGLPLSCGYAQFDFDKLNPMKIVEGTKKIVKGSTGIGLKEEMSIGGSVAVEIVSAYGGVWKDETATRRVNLIGKSLAVYCDRPELNYRFGILDSPTVNAFSAPGGYVFITRGTYGSAIDDDQLAAVLAHEIVHVTRRHALRIISRGEVMSGITGVAAGSSSDFEAFDSGVDDITKTLFKGGYDTGSEFDADVRGRDLAWRTGYERNGLLLFLQGLEAKSSGGSGFFSTHPPLKDRIKKLSGE